MRRYAPSLLKTLNRLTGFIQEENMFGEGDRVLAGVSGGADSVCLLFLLHEFLAPKYGLRLRVVHVNHGLRAAAADDAAFVEKLCEGFGIPCAVRHADVRGLCGRQGLGTEEAARILRYRIFEEEAAAWDSAGSIRGGTEDGKEDGTEAGTEAGRCRIALAHNLDDQAETVLHNLARGTSLRGLAGMQPVSGRLIRPLLIFSRKEIEEILSLAGMACRVDESNLTDDYTRNRLRHRVLPELAAGVNGNAAAHIAQAARDIAEADDLLDGLTDGLERDALLPPGERILPAGEEAAADEAAAAEEASGQITGEICAQYRIRTILDAPPVLAKRLLHRAISRAAGGEKDVARIHVDDVYAILGKPGSARIDLPRQVSAVREYGRLIFIKRQG